MRTVHLSLGLFLVGCVCALTALGQQAQQSPKPWTWRDSNRVTRTRPELDQILLDLTNWRESKNNQGHWVALRGAILTGANLAHADLHGADLTGAHLDNADLSGTNLIDTTLDGAVLSDATLNVAILTGAHLAHADLHGAHLNKAILQDAVLSDATLAFATLTGAYLYRANLTHANLESADLTHAILDNADLTSAYLDYANLTSAYLSAANLTNAVLYGAQLPGVRYEPTHNPPSQSIAYAHEIESLTYSSDPSALVQLRKQFENDGFRAAERKVTYALMRGEVAKEGWFEKWFNTITFDWTSQYGMNPGRALLIWLWLFLGCSVIYGVFIHHAGESGIYLLQHGPKKPPDERLSPRLLSPGARWAFPFRVIRREARVAFYGLYFSLMTAFSLGVWDINFGRWLHQFPRTEFDLKPKGWARPVAATQAALSVGLIVLWVLTYFGRPFE